MSACLEFHTFLRCVGEQGMLTVIVGVKFQWAYSRLTGAGTYVSSGRSLVMALNKGGIPWPVMTKHTVGLYHTHVPGCSGIPYRYYYLCVLI